MSENINTNEAIRDKVADRCAQIAEEDSSQGNTTS